MGSAALGLDVEFLATLREISGSHLGTRSNGSLGVGTGRAIGTFTVDGASVSLAHAYGEPKADAPGETSIVLSEKPIDPSLFAAGSPLADAFVASKALGLSFDVDTQGETSMWHFSHPKLYIGCRMCRDLLLAKAEVGKGAIGGTAYSRRPQSWEQQKYEFEVTFNASMAEGKARAEERRPR